MKGDRLPNTRWSVPVTLAPTLVGISKFQFNIVMALPLAYKPLDRSPTCHNLSCMKH